MLNSPLRQQSALNAGWSALDHMVLPVLWLITTPFFVGRLGVDLFGVWMLANILLNSTGAVSLGLGDATIKYVSKYRSLEDMGRVLKVIQTTLAVYLGLGALIAILIWVLAPLLVAHVFNVESQNQSVAILAIRVGGVGLAVQLIDTVARSVLFGFERYDLAAKVTAPTKVVTILLLVALVYYGFGVPALMVTSIMVTLLSAVFKVYVMGRSVLKGVTFTFALDREMLREVFGFGVYSWLQGIGGMLLGQIDRYVVAALLSTSALTYYTVCLQLAQQVHALLSKTAAFIFPLASIAKEGGDQAKLRRIYFKSLQVLTIAAVTIGLPIFIFASQILTIWMGSDFALEATNVLRILVFGAAIMATSIIPYYYMNGTGFVRLNTLFALVSGSIVAVSSFFLIPWVGLVGAALSRLTNLPTGLISRTILHYKVLDDRRWYAAFEILAPIFLLFGAATLVLIFIPIPEMNLLEVLAASAVAAGVAGGISYTICTWFASGRPVLGSS